MTYYYVKLFFILLTLSAYSLSAVAKENSPRPLLNSDNNQFQLIVETQNHTGKQHVINIANHTWVCMANRCSTTQATIKTYSLRNCRATARKLGVIISYGYRNTRFNKEQLKQCNTGLTSDERTKIAPSKAPFQLNREKTKIQFGDGINSRRPETGSTDKSKSYHTGAGNRLLQVTRAKASQGGNDAETIASTNRHVPDNLQHRGRAVTISDFKNLASQLPDDIARAKPPNPAHQAPASMGDKNWADRLFQIRLEKASFISRHYTVALKPVKGTLFGARKNYQLRIILANKQIRNITPQIWKANYIEATWSAKQYVSATNKTIKVVLYDPTRRKPVSNILQLK